MIVLFLCVCSLTLKCLFPHNRRQPSVIGKRGKYIHEKDALDYVAGFCIINDVSERAWQKAAGETKAKSCDTFGPLGPWLVTPDEIPDVQNLTMTTDILSADGTSTRMQDGNTKTMIFPVAKAIEYLSGIFTLHPGTVFLIFFSTILLFFFSRYGF